MSAMPMYETGENAAFLSDATKDHLRRVGRSGDRRAMAMAIVTLNNAIILGLRPDAPFGDQLAAAAAAQGLTALAEGVFSALDS